MDEKTPTLWQVLTCGPLTEDDKRNAWIANGWTLVWQAAFVAGLFVITRRDQSDWVMWAIIAGVVALGVAAILVFRRFVVKADELQRRIQLHSMAAGFGAAVLGGETLEMVAEGTGLQIPQIATMMIAVLTYMVSTVAMTRFYTRP